MTPDDFDEYLKSLGYAVEVVVGVNNVEYSVVKDLKIKTGNLKGVVCDVAIQRPTEIPYVLPAAIHTRPHLLPMDTAPPNATQAGQIGPEWQYWSRTYARPPSPRGIW